MTGTRRLAGRRTLVTGGASGIGLAIARLFAAEGAAVALLDRDRQALARAVEGWPGEPPLPLVVDLAGEEEIEPAVAEAWERLEGLDLLVNNAGIGLPKALLEHDLADFRRVFAINLFAPFALLREVARRMIADGRRGAVINIASVAGLRAATGRAAYGASKAALINLTQTAAVELAPHSIRVNGIAPGPIDTPLARAVHSAEIRAIWLQAVPMGRYGVPEDVARAALYLASEDARFVTGQVLAVDGGHSAASPMMVRSADGH